MTDESSQEEEGELITAKRCSPRVAALTAFLSPASPAVHAWAEEGNRRAGNRKEKKENEKE